MDSAPGSSSARAPLAATALRTVLALVIELNLWQTKQYQAGAIRWDKTTTEGYFDKFFSLKP